MSTNLDTPLARAARGSVIPILIGRRVAPLVDARYVKVRLPGEADLVDLSQEELAALLVLVEQGEVVLAQPFVLGAGDGGTRTAAVSTTSLTTMCKLARKGCCLRSGGNSRLAICGATKVT